MKRKIFNGISLYDQNKNPVNAHGSCIVQENGTYYLFGEYKTDDVNKYIGFSCYSTEDFMSWKFEGFALPPLKEGILGENRIGERVKVVKRKNAEGYTMLMHTDDMKYCDPCIGLATGTKLNEKFTFQGPLLFKGEPIRFWDMGTFTDEDGTSYLLTHEGNIYRLNEMCTEAVELMAEKIAPGGESPAMFKKDGIYYLMLSNKTSWERNDNYYFTASDLHGPWTYQGLFCPKGSLTYNSQCSFVFEYESELRKIPVYVGDRWSYPRQASAATLVMLPIETEGTKMSLAKYCEVWSPDTLEMNSLQPQHCVEFISNKKGESFDIDFEGTQIALFGKTDVHGGYGEIEIFDQAGTCVHKTSVDFYSGAPASGLRYFSPVLAFGKYHVKITVAGANSVCVTKSGTQFGSDGYDVNINGWSQFA